MTLVWCIFYNNYVFYVKVTSVSSQEIINIIKMSILIVLGHISPLPPPSPLLLIFVKRSMVWASFSGGGVNGYLRYAYSIYTGSKKLRKYQGEVELFSSVYLGLIYRYVIYELPIMFQFCWRYDRLLHWLNAEVQVQLITYMMA